MTTFYQKLNINLTIMYTERANGDIDTLQMEKEVTEKFARSLKIAEPRTPKFYTPVTRKPDNSNKFCAPW